MMRQSFRLILAFTVLLCLVAAALGEGVDYTTGSPWLDTDLDGNVIEDTPARLEDNFALYVNKASLLSLHIPEGYESAGTVQSVTMQSDTQLLELFHSGEPESHDARLAYDLFWLMMDWESRNALGVAPLKDKVDAVEAIDSIDAMTDYLTLPYGEGLGQFWTCGMSEDLDNTDAYILYVGPASLKIGETESDYGQLIKDAMSTLACKVLAKVGYTEAEAAGKFENCLKWEGMLSDCMSSREARMSPDYLASINNHHTRAEVEAIQGALPLLRSLEQGLGFPEADDYRVEEPDYFEKLNALYTAGNLPLMKDTLIVYGAISLAELLDEDCYRWSQDCGNTLMGIEVSIDDETAFAQSIAGQLKWPVARLYTETFLKPDDKARISALVDELVEAYHGIINEADFLSDTTRAKAIEKLEAIDRRVLYPDDWSAYAWDGLDFDAKEAGGTYWEASRRLEAYLHRLDVEAYSSPVDKAKWTSTPQTVNCFYDPLANSIYIMGAFAQGKIYDSGMSDEELYGKLGVVIGHEISHAFDSKGAQYDKNGNMSDWWTAEDYAAFREKNEKLAAYYDDIHPWAGQNLHGSAMTGETCADMAGFKCVLRAIADKPDFDYDAFFRAYADLWLNKETVQTSLYRIEEDVHPLSYLRINGTLQQFDEFLDFYDIKPGDGMYLNPEDRVLVW